MHSTQLHHRHIATLLCILLQAAAVSASEKAKHPLDAYLWNEQRTREDMFRRAKEACDEDCAMAEQVRALDSMHGLYMGEIAREQLKHAEKEEIIKVQKDEIASLRQENARFLKNWTGGLRDLTKVSRQTAALDHEARELMQQKKDLEIEKQGLEIATLRATLQEMRDKAAAEVRSVRPLRQARLAAAEASP